MTSKKANTGLVIGAGPIGVELALSLVKRIQNNQSQSGLQHVIVLEASPSVGGHLSNWKFVNFFSDWSFNVSEQGRTILSQNKDSIFAAYDSIKNTFPTGGQYVQHYLEPLKAYLETTGIVSFEFNARVSGISRRAFRKGDDISGQNRKMDEFRVITEAGKNYYGSFVFDCSGGYAFRNHKWLGAGGLPAEGEKQIETSRNVSYLIEDVLNQPEKFGNKHNIVVGSGYSAITMINALIQLQKKSPDTKITWITRQKEKVYERFNNDPLPERDRLSELGNQICAGDIPGVTHIGGFQYLEKANLESNQLQLTYVLKDDTEHTISCDNLLSATGYKPDTSLYTELHVHQCWASEGPMKLAATLIGGGGDCLAQTAPGPDLLKNPEPGFFILGYKSYGRNSRFLIKIGLEQIAQVVENFI